MEIFSHHSPFAHIFSIHSLIFSRRQLHSFAHISLHSLIICLRSFHSFAHICLHSLQGRMKPVPPFAMVVSPSEKQRIFPKLIPMALIHSTTNIVTLPGKCLASISKNLKLFLFLFQKSLNQLGKVDLLLMSLLSVRGIDLL